MTKSIRANAPFPSPTSWHTGPYPAIDPSLPALSAAGKTVVVTGAGAGAGIGFAVARAFAKAGASKIAVLGRTEKTLLSAKTSIEALYPETQVSAFTADIASEASVVTAFNDIKASLGTVDVLVSSAGYLPDLLSTADISVDEWWKGYEINVKGTFIVAKTALALILAEDAVVINVTSAVATITPIPRYSSYATSKIAGIKFYEYLQDEYSTRHFVSVHPGVIATAMNEKTAAAGMEFPQDDIELPASFMVWVASPEARFADGKTLWSNWDVEELKEKAEIIQKSGLFTAGLTGFPDYPTL